MHATRPTTRPLVAPTRSAPTPRAAPRRAPPPARAATSYSAPSKAGGATALDIIRRHSEVVPDTVLLGNRGTVDVPTAATVSAAVLAGLVANPGAGVREYQVSSVVWEGAEGGRGERRAQAGLCMPRRLVGVSRRVARGRGAEHCSLRARRHAAAAASVWRRVAPATWGERGVWRGRKRAGGPAG